MPARKSAATAGSGRCPPSSATPARLKAVFALNVGGTSGSAPPFTSLEGATRSTTISWLTMSLALPLRS